MTNPSIILIVDDNETNRNVLNDLVITLGHTPALAENGLSALAQMKKQPPDIVLLDILMPEMNGYEVLNHIKNDNSLRHIPVIMITALDNIDSVVRCIKKGADDYIVKPFNPTLLKARIGGSLEKKQLHDHMKKLQDDLKQLNASLVQKVKDRTEEIERTRDVAIFGLAKLAEYRDPETGQHLERIRIYAKILAQQLQQHEKYKKIVNDAFIDMIYKSSPLHDIGKVGIQDSVLLKQGKLTDEEFEIMKKHTLIGGSAIEAAEKDSKIQQTFLTMGKKIAYFHQEKFDGTGYPHGLKGESIPLEARIMALADVFDALVSKRVYKEAIAYDAAQKIILEGKGTHFDPDVVDAFIELQVQFKTIAQKHVASE